jgi:ABC-type multidrug transport system ATPase subunit
VNSASAVAASPVAVAPPRLAAEGLTKAYEGRAVISGVSFAVEAGQVCALLGPNGAGKTTTIRMLVGLSRPDSGQATLLGEPARLAGSALRGVGVMIDGPAFVPHLSGRRNLRLLWEAAGRSWPPPALDSALSLSGLGSALDRKVKTYSMGMRQRLTLAQALMGDPRGLVLDEPGNGLDPGEMRALREYLAHLARRGVAILVSSHLLAEVEELASHVVVLDRGSVIAAGPLDVLLKTGTYNFEVDDPATALSILVGIDGVDDVKIGDGRLLVTAPRLEAKLLTEQLVDAGVGILGIRAGRLEDVFLDLVGGEPDASL